jgi:hypothetical protein
MPLIWGEMEREIFLLKGLDRANHVESFQQIGVLGQPIAAGFGAVIGCSQGTEWVMRVPIPNG